LHLVHCAKRRYSDRGAGPGGHPLHLRHHRRGALRADFLGRCVGGCSMARKPRAPTPKGVPWEPDIYNIVEFVRGLEDLKTKPEGTKVPRFVMGRLAGLAGATDSGNFLAGMTFCLRGAHSDFPLLSFPVYRPTLIERIDEVEQAARTLRQKLQALKNPMDRTTQFASAAIIAELFEQDSKTKERKGKQSLERLDPVGSRLRYLSSLIAAVGKAKTSWPYVGFARERGSPSGVGESGMALTRFIAHLAFTALAAGGDWTLNKNDKSGTLIEAIEILRDFLPNKFLPEHHGYSTYQRILTDARSEWDSGRFPWPKLDHKH
jgi:hypothetical protein